MTSEVPSRKDYEKKLRNCMWNYRDTHFAGKDHIFRSEDTRAGTTPPVFLSQCRSNNVITDWNNTSGNAAILEEIPSGKRHIWFGSMKSSQALAQSVFANLKHFGKLGLLTPLIGDNGKALFPVSSSTRCQLEAELPSTNGRLRNVLGEQKRGATNIDVLLDDGQYRVGIECKLSESDIGKCSKADELPDCYLTAHGIHYWKFASQLFSWPVGGLCEQCKMRGTYQLVRNILAVTVSRDGYVNTAAGHVVLLYDARNPAFDSAGDGLRSWEEAKNYLLNPDLLQRCTWQEVVKQMRTDTRLDWLTNELKAKYGF